MAHSERATHRQGEPDPRRIRRVSGVLAGSLVLLAALLGLRLIVGDPTPLDWLAAGSLVLVVVAAALLWRTITSLEADRRAEAESTARLLRGLSRSVSADAIVAAIAGELAVGAEVDHVAVVRRRDDPPRLEATLFAARPGIPDARTTLPIADLLAPVLERAGPGGRDAPMAIPVARGGAEPVTVAVAVDPAVADRPRGAGPDATVAGAHQAHPIELALRGDGVARVDPGRVAERIASRVRGAFGLRHVLAAPLVVGDQVVGALVLSRRASPAWSEASRRLLDEAATEASLALGRADSQRAAEARASTDALTGLPNRRYFDEFCGLLARRRRSGDAVGVLMVDIDHFKRLNDRLGHPVGDEVLRAVGGAIAATVRGEDIPARYGGEEFVVLLRNPSPDVAIDVAERIRAAVRRLDLLELRGSRMTVSVGAAVQADPEEPIVAIVERADRALYRAKKDGRDRVVAA